MFYDRMKGKKGSKLRSNELDDGNHEETALVTGNFKRRCRGCSKFGHKKSDCTEEKKEGDKTKKFTSKCFHCGKKGHRKADCWELKKSDKANKVQDDEDGDKFALVIWSQACDIEYSTSSHDGAVHDIIDWRGRVMLGMNNSINRDIIDYTNSDEETKQDFFIKVDHRSWNKIAYWKETEADIDSDSNSSSWSEHSSVSNQYKAL